MDNNTVIAAAQMCAEDENIEYNLKAHYRLVKLAADNGVQLLVFPEMSITGYVREAADRLAFSRGDMRLDELRKLAAAHNMTIIAGAPVRLGASLHVGSFVMKPDLSVSLYTKQYLYKNENDFFMPNCGNNPAIQLNDEKISLAICFDMENTPHVAKAAEAGSTIYTPSIFYSEAAIDDAHVLLSGYAQTYGLNVLMSNYCGHLYHTPSGGKSAFWNTSGELLACMDSGKTGLVLGVKDEGTWRGQIVEDENDIYTICPNYKNSVLSLRKTTEEDASELFKCYADEKAVPFFNSDNCNGDDFHYTTLERLLQTMDLWDYSYNTRRFVRWTVIANESGEKVGTIEMFDRSQDASIGRYGILRIDLRSDFETPSVITAILDIAREHFYDAFHVNAILTKAIPAAAIRIAALLNGGYRPFEGNLVKFGDYFVRVND